MVEVAGEAAVGVGDAAAAGAIRADLPWSITAVAAEAAEAEVAAVAAAGPEAVAAEAFRPPRRAVGPRSPR